MLPQSICHAAYPLPGLSREQIDALKQPIDLREEIERDLGPGQRSGKWRKYHSPFRDDRKPSFGVCEGVFIDFGTGQRGDILTWLRDYRGLGFRDGLAWLVERDHGYANGYPSRPRSHLPARPTDSNPNPPPATWQQIALRELGQAERCLWSSIGANALAYLRDVRGLDDETIRHFRLGYNPAWKRTQHRHSDTGKSAHLAPGIVIPWFVNEHLWALKVRCRVGNLAQALGVKPDLFFDKETRTYVESPKYLNLADGNQAGALFNADTLTPGNPVLVVEGEFDAMLSWQSARDYIAAVTLGSASYELPPHWRERLASAPVVLSSLDNDQAGEQATTKLASSLGNQLRRVRLPIGKDLTEFVVDHHGDASAWIQLLLTGKEDEADTSSTNGLPDAIRHAGLTFLTAALVMVAELWHQAAQRKMLAHEQPFTIQQLLACSEQLGWAIKASTIAEALATDRQAGEVFFEKLDPKTHPKSSVQEDSGSNKPKKGGRPADRYRARSMQAVVEALLLHAHFRLTEKCHPVGGKALAEVDTAWFTALGFEQTEAEGLAERAREQFANLPVDRLARASLQRDLDTLRRGLKQVLDSDAPSSPLPAAWTYCSPSQYRAAVLRALVEAAPDQRRSRRSLARSIGVSEASISAYLERAGLENVKQFEYRLLGVDDLARQIRQAERRCQGYARRLISLCGETSSEVVFNWQSLAQAERWVRAQQAAGANVFVRLQVASVQRIAPTLTDIEQDVEGSLQQRKDKMTNRRVPGAAPARCLRRVERSHAVCSRQRYLGPTFDPTWVAEQLLLGYALVTGQVYRPGRVYDERTGEVVVATDVGVRSLTDLTLNQVGWATEAQALGYSAA